MNHKEKMEWLKENDPIQYYELTSNPTGVNKDDSFGCLVFAVIMVISIIIGFSFFCGK